MIEHLLVIASGVVAFLVCIVAFCSISPWGSEKDHDRLDKAKNGKYWFKVNRYDR